MFDPYRKWLGIPESQRPPTHYQLLAIAPDENDPDVITAAVVRQSAYVRNFQAGKYADDATRLLTELAAAKACLLDRGKRMAYDAELKKRHQPPTAENPTTTDEPELGFAPEVTESEVSQPTPNKPAPKAVVQKPVSRDKPAAAGPSRPASAEVAPWDLPLSPLEPAPVSGGFPAAKWDGYAPHLPGGMLPGYAHDQMPYAQPSPLGYAPPLSHQPVVAANIPLAEPDSEWWQQIPRWAIGTACGGLLLLLLAVGTWVMRPEPPVRPPDYSNDGSSTSPASQASKQSRTSNSNSDTTSSSDQVGTQVARPPSVDEDDTTATMLTPPGVLKSGERLRAYGGDDEGAIQWLDFSADGQYLLSCSVLSDSKGSLRLWTVAAGGEFFLSGTSDYPRHSRPFSTAIFLNDPFDIVGLEANGFARFDRFRGRKLTDSTDYVNRNVRFGKATCAALSRNGKVAAWGNKSSLAVAECRHDGPTWMLSVTSPMRLVAIDPRGEYVSAALDDRTVHTWTAARTGKDAFKPWQTDAAINGLAFSFQGDRLAAVCDDGTLYMWQAGRREDVFEKLVSKRKLACVAFSPDGSRVIVADKSGFVQIHQASDGQLVSQLQAESSGPITAVALSPDGQLAATGNPRGAVRIWKLDEILSPK